MNFPESTIEQGPPSRDHALLLSRPPPPASIPRPGTQWGFGACWISQVHSKGARHPWNQKCSPRLLGDEDAAGLEKTQCLPGRTPWTPPRQCSQHHLSALASTDQHSAATREIRTVQGRRREWSLVQRDGSIPVILLSLPSASLPHKVSWASQTLTWSLRIHPTSVTLGPTEA